MPPKRRFNIGPIIGLAIAGWMAVSLVQTVRKNYDLKRQIKAMEAEIGQLKEQKEELAYRIQYYETDSYKEKEARSKLGLQQPGEGVVVLPKHSQPPDASQTPEKPKSNWRLWWEFLFG